jgi:exopolysaccharide production protein ExoQ
MLKLFERWFVVLMLFYLSSGLLGFIWPDSETSLFRPESSAALLAIQTILYGVTFLLIALRWERFKRGILAGRWALALALLAICSAMWADDPNLTLRRGLVLLGTTAFGIYLGSAFSLREQLQLITRAFGLILLLSIFCALAFPQYGVDREIHGGDWQGIFAQKNLLGKAMIISTIAFLSSGGLYRRWVRWAFVAASILVALLSNSLTSLATIGVLLLLAPAYRLLRVKKKTLIPVLIGIGTGMATAIFLAIRNQEIVLQLMDRSISLTGRTDIWRFVWEAISQRMVLGYGFNGFWEGIGGASASVILSLGWVAKHAHDGFLDLWLELGIVGLALFAMGYFSALREAIHLLTNDRSPEATWPMQYLAFMFVYHITEGPILRQNSLYWALYTATLVCVSSWQWHAERSTAEIPAEGNSLEPQLDYLPG